jgi:hypothetical protein
VGTQLPEGVIEDMSDTMRREIWVLGVCYIPVKYVRKFSRRQKGYMFHTELSDDEGDKALYGGCPEIVRLENCLKWHPMSTVSRDVPRIVHADDIKNRRVHVAGRAMHFVCGVTAIEVLHCQEFRLSPLPRRNFFMYPEHRSGVELNSASMMWEHIDIFFAQIRQCMRAARHGTSSASFQMPYSVASYEFLKVRAIKYDHIVIKVLAVLTLCTRVLGNYWVFKREIGSHIPQAFQKRDAATRRSHTNKLCTTLFGKYYITHQGLYL